MVLKSNKGNSSSSDFVSPERCFLLEITTSCNKKSWLLSWVPEAHNHQQHDLQNKTYKYSNCEGYIVYYLPLEERFRPCWGMGVSCSLFFLFQYNIRNPISKMQQPAATAIPTMAPIPRDFTWEGEPPYAAEERSVSGNTFSWFYVQEQQWT